MRSRGISMMTVFNPDHYTALADLMRSTPSDPVSVRHKLPYLRALIPDDDSSRLEALLGAIGWSLVTGIVGWWSVSWLLTDTGDWADFFLYIVLVVAAALWTGESWYVVLRTRRRQTSTS